MRVYIKNKIVSVGGGSAVVDENENPIYNVKGKVFSITRVKKLYDMSGKMLYKIKNKWINIFNHRAYIYDENNNKIATVRNKAFTVRRDFLVQGYKDEIKVDGNFFSLKCNILSNGEIIGELNRNFGVITDKFELIADAENIPFLIALTIAIDNISDNAAN